MVSERANAKINLTLDVLFKRPDGYHEVEMVMQTVDLADHLHMNSVAEDRIQLSCNVPFIPLDERNLVYKAALLLKKTYGITEGVHIEIDKHIPVAAGLAGGSSDAAATLRGLNRLWNLELTADQLAELGAEIGSDVPFCVYGGTAVATGRGEKIERLPNPAPLWVVLVKPPIAVSTADVYRNLNAQNISHHPNTQAMREALQAPTASEIFPLLGNVLESVTSKMHPEVGKLKEQMIRFGANAALMSGSGPTVFGITDREQRAQRIYNAFRGFAKEVYLSRFL